jgi:tRNA threonylcarbamoyl adenosine modification protein (Sua5/YciO/YrdC/YwlC family)
LPIGDAAAARRIRQIRGLDDGHHLTLVLRDLSEIGHFARLDNRQFRIVRQGTPGTYTFLLPATREVPRRLQHPKRSTVGVRVPDHAVVQALLAELGEPILSSTLICRRRGAQRRRAIRTRWAGCSISSSTPGRAPRRATTVVDLAVEPAVIVRLGAGDPARLGLE